MTTAISTSMSQEFLAAAGGYGPARVVSDEGILGGMPVVLGTRVPAATLVAYLRDGCSPAEIIEDYPTLPPAWLDAVEDWAKREHGPGWLTASADRPA